MEILVSPPKRGAFIAKIGVWLQLAQIIGFAGSMTGMMKAFKVIGSPGPGDPAQLSQAIGEVLQTAFAGVMLSLVGLILVIIAVTACRYRAVWMFWFLCIYGGLMIGSHFFPFGLFFLIYALVKKNEFLPPVTPQVQPVQIP